MRLISFRNAPATFGLHLSLVVIVVGALITHFCGIQGRLTLGLNSGCQHSFEVTDGPSDGILPFEIRLKDNYVDYYRGTVTPRDYGSVIEITDCNITREIDVSMNRVGKYRHWRLYQTGISGDGSTLSVSYDPWGIGVTYVGYVMLGISMIGFFFQRKTIWRGFCRKAFAVVIMAVMSLPAVADDVPRSIQRPLASDLGKIYVYYNGRVCPMQTMAKDVARRLYGSETYKTMSAEQILAGWLFYYDDWKRDFDNIQSDISNSDGEGKRRQTAIRQDLIFSLGSGELFKVYPYHSASGHTEWLSLSERRPSKMSMEQWRFMLSSVRDIQKDILSGHNIDADKKILEFIDGQQHYAGIEYLPSDNVIQAERMYNSLWSGVFAAIVLLIVGVGGMVCRKIPEWLVITVSGISLIYILLMLVLRGFVGNYFPATNGHETMLCMSAISLMVAIVSSWLANPRIVSRGLVTVAAFALLVAGIGGNPPIGALMPVLASPLLSVHVLLVMASYTLFMLMAVAGIVGIVRSRECHRMATINRALLVPAVFLLAGGIFLGAVWANQSWGRYWGWDPKETCALVTMIIYAIPIHSASIGLFRNSRAVNIYLVVAVIAVLFTYFGANYLLPGLHSYA